MNKQLDSRAFDAPQIVDLPIPSGFSINQVRKLHRPVPADRIRTRLVDGKTLSYVEGWYAISKANEIFGEAGWDRETIRIEPIDTGKSASDICGYMAKVRITIRSHGAPVVREGTGCGWAFGTGATMHERAFKAAETDATKRALATFGAALGLCLYEGHAKSAAHASYTLFSSDGGIIAAGLSPESYCSGFRQLIAVCRSVKELEELSRLNLLQLEQLRASAPDLKNGQGLHFTDLLERLLKRALSRLEQVPGITPASQNVHQAPVSDEPRAGKIDKSTLPIGQEKRYRDKAHLQRVSELPCLVCNRQPSHAHHLKFAQSRGMSQKVSDEFVVPLCALHHGDLHRSNSEDAWWHSQNLDPLSVAAALWTSRRVALAQ